MANLLYHFASTTTVKFWLVDVANVTKYSSKVRLGIITGDYFHPTRHRVHGLLPHLRENFDVSIINISSFSYDFPNTSELIKFERLKIYIKRMLSSIRTCIATVNDVTIIRSLPFTHRSMLITKLAYFVVLPGLIRKICKRKNVDVCLAIAPFCGYSALMAGLDIPIIYEDTDRCEYFEGRTVRKEFVHRIERYSIRHSAAVISTGYRLAESASKIRGNEAHCIPNGTDYELLGSIPKSNPESEIWVVYSGSMVLRYHRLDIVMSAIRSLMSRIPNIRFVVLGTGKDFLRLKGLVKKRSLEDNVILLGKVDYLEYLKILRRCSVAVAPFAKDGFMEYAFPLKIVDYMAAGLPIVATDVGDTGYMIRRYGSGILVDLTPESIAEGIERLVRNPLLVDSISQKGRTGAKDYDWKELAKNEIKIIMNTLAGIMPSKNQCDN